MPWLTAPTPSPPPPPRRATVLVVDDEPVNRTLLKGLLRRNFDVVEAASGADALALAPGGLIDVVVMDIHMPGMGGFEATPLIKAAAGERYLPVILMTASNEEALLSEGLARGADDFLLKPISRTLLEAKVNALLRAADVFRVLRDQNRELTARRAAAQRDYEIARGVFDRVTRRSRLDLPDVIAEGSSLEAFNGDLLLAAQAGSKLRLLVGDFTGHGLSAAVGALPVSEVFFAMTQQAFALGDLVRELAEKLHRMFPRDLFLAACLVDIDLVSGSLAVWNGGLPDALVFSGNGELVARAPSRHPPLGILPGAAVDRAVVQLPFARGARLAVFSDGLPESRGKDGTMFGIERVERELTAAGRVADWTAPLREAHAAFRGLRAVEDDITFVGITHTPALAAALADEAGRTSRGRDATRASLHVRFDASAVKRADALAPLLDLLATPALFGPRRVDAQVILTELFANAVDHGLLALDSGIKETPGGFAAYHRLRDERLASLADGFVSVDIGLVARCGGKAVVITVADTGRGFVPGEQAAQGCPYAKAGRGLQLVRALAQELDIRNGGTTVEAVLAMSPVPRTGGRP